MEIEIRDPELKPVPTGERGEIWFKGPIWIVVLAVIVAEPAETAVTAPTSVTVAIAGAELVQAIVFRCSGVPAAS